MSVINATMRGRTAVWGIKTESGDTHAAGIITGQGRKKDSDKDFCYDNEGFIITEVFYNMSDECSIKLVCEDATAEPDNGDDIQIAGTDCIVQNSEQDWSQRGWKGLSITAKKFQELSA